MDITTFKVVASEMVNPSVVPAAMVGLIGFLILILGSICYTHTSRRMLDYPRRTKNLIVLVCFFIAVIWVYAVKHYNMHINPEAYTKYVTCKYTLQSGNEFINHETQIPRSNSSACSSLGTQVTRVRTDKSTMFFLDFEKPH